MTVGETEVGQHPGDPSAPAPPGDRTVPRGLPVAVVAIVVAVGAGTWLLGSSPESAVSPGDNGPAAVAPQSVPAVNQAPLSVAPAPSDEAYAAAKRASRAHKRAATKP